MDVLLKDKQVAELLGCSRSSVHSWVKNGFLPKPIKLGRTIRWSGETLRNWLKEQEGASPEAEQLLAQKRKEVDTELKKLEATKCRQNLAQQ